MFASEIREIMSTNHITIRQAAEAFDISLKRVRHVRHYGVQTDILEWEWSVWLPNFIRAQRGRP